MSGYSQNRQNSTPQFPNSGGFPPPNPHGYNPPSFPSHGPSAPRGPPPPVSRDNYPGQQYQHQNTGSYAPPPTAYAQPPGSSYNIPSGPPYTLPPGPSYPPLTGPSYPPPTGPSYPPPPGPSYPPPTGPSYPPPAGPSYPPPTGPSYGTQPDIPYSATPDRPYNIPAGPPYGAPPGPPPGRPSPYPPPSGSPGNYLPPSGPPGGYRGPPGPPPMNPAYSYAPPSGLPPRPPNQDQFFGPQMQAPNNQVQQAFFCYSQCSGKKKALCIGINYSGQQGELRGCINDANNMKRFLITQYGYKEDDMVVLTDDTRDPRQSPTQQNILRAMEWLVRGARRDDSLFFHYSGHGGQTKDLDGDEEDGYDEVIYPVDFKQNGHIVDDVMHQIMVRPLPPGCRLTAIFDSCHSGSALDLPYVYSTEGKLKEPNLAAEAGQGLLSAVASYARGDMSGVLSTVTGLVRTAGGGAQKADRISKATRTSPADCISWSGCKDSQTSADSQEAGRATGAMSYAFIKALSQNPQQSYQQLLVSIRTILRSKYSQKPQLSSSHPMDTNLLFIV